MVETGEVSRAFVLGVTVIRGSSIYDETENIEHDENVPKLHHIYYNICL
jgi:hypothetical protein